MNEKKKLLIIKHGALGDLIQSDGVLKDLRRHFSNAELVLLTDPKFEPLMQRCPHIDRIICDSRAPWWHLIANKRLFTQLKQEQFHGIIDLQNSNRTQFYQQLLFNKISWYGRQTSIKPKSGLKGQIDILRNANIPLVFAEKPNVKWMADDVSALINSEHISQPYIALIPGCSAKHPEKRWPYYAKLAETLLTQGYDVVNILGPDERNLVNTLPGHTLIEKRGISSWFEMAGLLNEADFVVGNDTGPSHIASCLGKAGLALFGNKTSAARAEIQRGSFKAIEVDNLADLSVDSVVKRIYGD